MHTAYGLHLHLIANLKDIIYLQNVWFAHLSNYLSALTITVCAFLQKRRWRQSARKLHFFWSFTKVPGSFHVSLSLVGWAPILCRCLCCFCCFHSAQPWIPKWNCQNTFKMHTLFLCADTWKTVFSSCVCVCVRVCVSDPALLISSITASPPLSLPLAVCENAEPCAWRLMLDS